MTNLPDDWVRLLKAAEGLGSDPEEVEAFLRFVVAPPQLICGLSVLVNSCCLLSRLSFFIELEPEYAAIISQDQIDAWLWSLELLAEADPSDFGDIKGFDLRVPFGRKPPLQNYLKSHPLYTFLCHLAPEKYGGKLFTCQALSILVDARLRGAEEKESLDYSALRYKFLLDLRKLVEREDGRKLLEQFPEEPLSLENYIQQVDLLKEKNENLQSTLIRLKREGVGELLDHFQEEPLSSESYSQQVSSLKEKNKILQSILVRFDQEQKHILPTKKSSAQRSHPGGVYVSEEGTLVGDKNDGTTFFRTSGLKSQPDSIVEQFRRDGGYKTEIETGHSLVTSVAGGVVEVDDGSTKRQRAHAVRGYRNRISMLNQLLPSQKPGLSAWEAAKLITFLFPPAEEKEPSLLLSEDVRLALSLMLWSSVELQELNMLKFYAESHYLELVSSGKAISPGLMGRRGKVYAIILPATAPVQHTDPDQLKHLILPLPELISSLWQSHRPKRVHSNRALFSKGKNGIIQKVTDALRDIRKREQGDYTPSRISRHLFHLSLTLPAADITEPMYWSGKNHYLGRVVAHYTRHTAKQLREHYIKSCVELMLQVSDDLAHMGWGYPARELLVPIAERVEQSGGVGSPFCPDIGRLKKIFFDLKVDIGKYRPSQKGQLFPRELYKLHNSYTLYTMLTLALASGARVIAKAVKVPVTVHVDSGFAVINEKNSLDYFNSRLIWLPPDIQQQYRNYIDHLNNIFLWLYLVDQKKALSLKTVLNGEKLGSEVSPAWLFMLDESNNVIPVENVDIVGKLGEYGFNFKGNALRHLLRTRAIKHKVPTEIINAQLGHWDNGQAPWEKWSFLSTATMKEKLSPFLEDLLAEVAFQSLEGLGALREDYDDLDELENIQTAKQISLFG
jgi:hypothetical protein